MCFSNSQTKREQSEVTVWSMQGGHLAVFPTISRKCLYGPDNAELTSRNPGIISGYPRELHHSVRHTYNAERNSGSALYLRLNSKYKTGLKCTSVFTR